MKSNLKIWEPTNHQSWARTLGLVHVPLFGHKNSSPWPGETSVLLDGRKASFAILSIDDSKMVYDDDPRSWSWSANLQHMLFINKQSDDMHLCRWDSNEYRHYRLPKDYRGAEDLLTIIENSKRDISYRDVITQLLKAFRQIREIMPLNDALDSIKVFNAFLVGTEEARKSNRREVNWLRTRTVEDALSFVGKSKLKATGAENLNAAIRNQKIYNLPSTFLSSTAFQKYRLHPDLLLRHAAGELYQEAHLIIERENQLYLPGLSEGKQMPGKLQRDVRFTPTSLARTLVQQAFKAYGKEFDQFNKLDILDPACGSGVFLQEAIRELQAREFTGKVTLRGYDTSEISCAMSRFCLERAKIDAKASGITVQVDIKKGDALQNEWGKPDFILMNPPFTHWEGMEKEEQDIVKTILQGLLSGTKRVDKSMAFIWKGANCLQNGSIIASVLPAPIFENEFAYKWREALSSCGELYLLGRFQGYGYFRYSMVEPGFLVLQKPQRRKKKRERDIKIVLAESGKENASIRALRKYVEINIPQTEKDWEIFHISSKSISSASWLPRPSKHMKIIENLADLKIPTVGKLFEIHQGMKTGNNPVFIISNNEFKQLPAQEHKYFRPAAMSKTIQNGILLPKKWAFYPYDEKGLMLKTEQDVKKRIPKFYERKLYPSKKELSTRAGINPEFWWELVRHRPSWLRTPKPKIISKYFGEAGSFAYDEEGKYVVITGQGWLWREVQLTSDIDFYDTSLPFAYLALLNSPLFEALLACFCKRVQGGQFDLSKRFVDSVFIPNLADDFIISSDVVDNLAKLGRRIHNGKMPLPEELNKAAARAYGISYNDVDWMSDY
jgi:methylase of polypeptide subunit release factors